MRYRLLAFGFLLSLGPLIGTSTAQEPPLGSDSASPKSDDDSKDIHVIADLVGSLFGSLHTACQIDMTGTTARRNVAATANPAVLQTARSVGHPDPTRRAPTARFVGYETPTQPPTLASSAAVSKAVAHRSRYERRPAGVLFAKWRNNDSTYR